MDFSRVELSDEDQTFLHQVRDFLGSQVTEDVIRHDRETGDNFHEGVHLALGARGFLEKEWKPTADGGLVLCMISSVSREVLPKKGTSPVSSSCMTTPTAYRSARPSTRLPSACSGDM